MGTVPLAYAVDGVSSPTNVGDNSPPFPGAEVPIVARGFQFYRGAEKFLIRGISYGPFRPNERGIPYPSGDRLREDLDGIAKAGANVVRLYALPDDELADAAREAGLRLLIDIPWPTHLDVYSDPVLEQRCLSMVEEGMTRVKNWRNVLGVFLGNEIRPDLVRWVGERKVRRLLRRLYTRAKSIAPEILVGFANYPSTEYIRLDRFDFVGFNVYLENAAVFRDYLVRLRHLYPEKPLIVSECGLDSLRSSELDQARYFENTLETVYAVGAAGGVVFSWTDEWHTGGHDIEGWAFGIVNAERRPKPAYESVRRAFVSAPQCRRLESAPRFSVVVATYNGGATLRECLRSLQRLKYPDFEIIVVDDGSTDDTVEILKDFPDVRTVLQENRGLSAARNAGIGAATGEFIAFTDSDCYVDPDWLYHLAVGFHESDHAGLGGPNLTPKENGPWPRAVALAPGHATHVLLNLHEAEHVPGCNMAFRRDALDALGGFDPQFRKAGDDVDLVWRLRDLGYTVGFSPAAFVWHHRRNTLKAYWKQHIGYGEAEGLLIQKHPHRFNDRGESMWLGAIYPGDQIEPLFNGTSIHYGVFGSAGYQCIYQRAGSVWPHYFTSLEWWLLCLGFLVLGLLTDVSLAVALIGFGISLSISGIRAFRRWNRNRTEPAWMLLSVWLLWITQPLVRSAARYRARLGLVPQRDGRSLSSRDEGDESRKSIAGRKRGVLAYWGESGTDRLDVLRAFEGKLARFRWIHFPNSGWEPWDLSVVVSWWFKILVVTSEENHGGPKRALRFRFRIAPTGLLKLLAAGAFLLCVFLSFYGTVAARYLLTAFLVLGWVLYRRAGKDRLRLETLAEEAARESGYVLFPRRVEGGNGSQPAPTKVPKPAETPAPERQP